MAKDPAFLFYPGDWLGGTMCFTLEEKGAYLELLILQFNQEKFTEAQAKHMLSTCSSEVWTNIKHKFVKDGNYYYQNRLKEEIEKRRAFSLSRKNNALAGKNKKAYAEHMEDENENRNEDVINNVNIPFENFWNLYDKKVGDKTKLVKKWNKLKDSERESIMIYIPEYIKSQPEKKFRKNPDTFLNNKSWLDEIITDKPIKQNKQKRIPANVV